MPTSVAGNVVWFICHKSDILGSNLYSLLNFVPYLGRKICAILPCLNKVTY